VITLSTEHNLSAFAGSEQKVRYTGTHLLRFMATISHLTVTPTSGSIHTSLIALLDPENVAVAVAISLLSYIQAEILDNAYVLPVTVYCLPHH
jgi:hypothetical protein